MKTGLLCVSAWERDIEHQGTQLLIFPAQHKDKRGLDISNNTRSLEEEAQFHNFRKILF